MKPLRSAIRPIIKRLIVNQALSGHISPQEAQRLIAERGLKGA